MKKIIPALVDLASTLLFAGCGSHSSSASSSSSSSQTSAKSKLFASDKQTSSKKQSSTTGSQASQGKASGSTSSTSSSTSSKASESDLETTLKSATTQAPSDATQLGLTAYYTHLLKNGWTADQISADLDSGDITNISITDVSGQNVTSDYGKGVTTTFPANTYQVFATPLADGMITYQVINDNTIRVFDVPSHFQDDRWASDAAWAKQTAADYMGHPQTVRVQTPSSDLMGQLQEALYTGDSDDD